MIEHRSDASSHNRLQLCVLRYPSAYITSGNEEAERNKIAGKKRVRHNDTRGLRTFFLPGRPIDSMVDSELDAAVMNVTRLCRRSQECVSLNCEHASERRFRPTATPCSYQRTYDDVGDILPRVCLFVCEVVPENILRSPCLAAARLLLRFSSFFYHPHPLLQLCKLVTQLTARIGAGYCWFYHCDECKLHSPLERFSGGGIMGYFCSGRFSFCSTRRDEAGICPR